MPAAATGVSARLANASQRTRLGLSGKTRGKTGSVRTARGQTTQPSVVQFLSPSGGGLKAPRIFSGVNLCRLLFDVWWPPEKLETSNPPVSHAQLRSHFAGSSGSGVSAGSRSQRVQPLTVVPTATSSAQLRLQIFSRPTGLSYTKRSTEEGAFLFFFCNASSFVPYKALLLPSRKPQRICPVVRAQKCPAHVSCCSLATTDKVPRQGTRHLQLTHDHCLCLRTVPCAVTQCPPVAAHTGGRQRL